AVARPDRMWFNPQKARLPLHSESLDAYAMRARQLGAPPMAWHSRDDMLRPGAEPVTKPERDALWALPPSIPLEPRWEQYRPNHVRFTVTCPEPGYLAVTDRWARGWDTLVNGQAIETEGAMFLWRGIPVEAGDNVIEMHYRPDGLGRT